MKKKSFLRFKEIMGVFASYGFGYLIDSKKKRHEDAPKNLRRAFEELGSTFIKIGQILSTRPDILPEEYINELSKLQDSTNEEDFFSIKQVFFDEFKIDIEKAFKDIDIKPVACASIAQAYKAELNDGRKVIVKIQRPGIEEMINTDIHILKKLLGMVSFINEDEFLMNPVDALKEIEIETNKELNFELEKENILKFRELNKDVACIYAPKIIDEYCGRRVITMEYIEGFKITDIDKIEEYGYDRYDIGKKLALSFCKQVFNDGFFHGDPHPGNILIADNKICYIDFGSVGVLTESMKKSFNDAMVGVATRDTNKLVNFLIGVGIRRGKMDRNMLYEDVKYLLNMYLSTSIKNIKMSMLIREIIEIAKRNNIQLPIDFVMISKSALIIEGVVSKVSPDMDILDFVIPYVESKNKYYFRESFNYDNIMISLYSFLKRSSELPDKYAELAENLNEGRVKVKIESTEFKDTMKEVNKMTNRVVFGVVVSGMIIGSSYILSANVGPKIKGVSIIGITGYVISGIFALYLLISILRSGNLK